MSGSCFSAIDRQRSAPSAPPCACKAPDALYHYIIVRADLPPGFQAAQIVHAAGLSAAGRDLPIETNAVVLTIEHEGCLLNLAARLAHAGVPHVLVRENDAPYSGQATAIGIPPRVRGGLRTLLSTLPLLGKEAPVR